MPGRLNGENRKMRDAVAARLRKSQDNAGLSDAARARQNKRVADRIKKQQGDR